MDEKKYNVEISGKVISEPWFSFEENGERYYDLFVEVKRAFYGFSGLSVNVHVRTTEKTVVKEGLTFGKRIAVCGVIESYVTRVRGKEYGYFIVRAEGIGACVPYKGGGVISDKNEVKVTGVVREAPILNNTHNGGVMLYLTLDVEGANGIEKIPCTAYGNVLYSLQDVEKGDVVSVEGRIFQRSVCAGAGNRGNEYISTYELEIVRVAELPGEEAGEEDGNEENRVEESER